MSTQQSCSRSRTTRRAKTLYGPYVSKSFFRKRLFLYLLRKPPPKRISSLDPIESKDYIYVHGKTSMHGDCLFLAYQRRENSVTYVYWQDGNSSESSQCGFEDVDWSSLRVVHEYRRWNVSYDSLIGAALGDAFRGPLIRQTLTRLRSYFYKSLPLDHRFRLLEVIVASHTEFKKLQVRDLVASEYGPWVLLSDDYYKYEQQMRFLLESLAESGDVVLRGEHEDTVAWIGEGDVRPLPKALTTVSRHMESERRHSDTVRLVRLQLFLGVAMLAMAAATVYVELR